MLMLCLCIACIHVLSLYWAAIPGNAADFPAEESFHTFIEQAVCLFTEETNYRSSLSPFGIKMVDRLTGIMSKARMWCWWTRETPIRACAA